MTFAEENNLVKVSKNRHDQFVHYISGAIGTWKAEVPEFGFERFVSDSIMYTNHEWEGRNHTYYVTKEQIMVIHYRKVENSPVNEEIIYLFSPNHNTHIKACFDDQNLNTFKIEMPSDAVQLLEISNFRIALKNMVTWREYSKTGKWCNNSLYRLFKNSSTVLFP